ncbi:ABC transporter permease [Salipiger marinus]|jgi:ABC-type dipeptide/oligopeptide/nickel transport system permease subunit|uniref:ABC transporter permease n=1 Tax=Salipiger marinus TaxID=555512 RepID=UPI000E8E1A2D|nr:ABC transporter permease [Salipiger manganoxidans]MEB3419147.1 ABC transporter permease [Salipiger manganoxidans]HBM60273.1 ABC transporter permease [Citreicella sp.]HBT02907.1 ABC transporter permease [Citreicella sp.]|tara:strand:+ start:2149 stop:2991 length:843 start_codon:yes stop_codon:yes gene_type:complete
MKALSRYLATPLVLIGGLLSFGWLLVAILAPLIAPYDPLQTIQPLMRPLNSGPNGEFFLLGTDMLGRDIFSRLIWGAQTVVIYSTLATLTAYVFGLSLGLVAGYAGGRTDAVLCYLANVVLSFPVLVLYIVIIVVIGASPLNIVIAVTFSSAPAIFRIVRAITIDVASRDFVKAAITQGESTLRILFVDILPNTTGPLAVDFCLRLGYTAITIGTLGFLGLGLPPPTPDWGGMVNEGRGMAIAFPHLVIFPCIAISSLTLGLSLLADGLREVNDAKERQA